jgi:hypothetical protein
VSFDDHIRKALDRTLTGVRGHLERDFRAFAEDLVRVASDERVRAVKEAAEQGAGEVRRQALEQLTQLRDATQKHVDDVRCAAESQISELKGALDTARRATQEEIDTARREAQAEVAETRRASEAAVADAVERARIDGHQTALAQASRLADAVRTLEEAGTLGDVLTALAECAARDVDRTAVFVVKNGRLAGWRLHGFDTAAPSARSLDLSLEDAGLPGAVVRTGVAVSRPAVEPGQTSERQPALPPFARDAGIRHALALPVTVGGTVVGVLYADAPRVEPPSSSSRWPAVLDVLSRHASRVLEAMTVQQAAGLSLPRTMARGSHSSLPGPIEHTGRGADEDAARRCARLLLSEIRMFNEPLVDAGRRSRDLLSRLSGEIERARRLYEARVSPDVRARTEYFDQELVRTLADGDSSLLGSVQ